MIARPEGVDIITLADPDIAQARHQQPLRRGKVFRRGHFQVLLAAGDDQRRHAGRLGDRGIVGQDLAHRRAMRRQDRGKMKPLRGLRPP